MSIRALSRHHELASTYFIQSSYTKHELNRLSRQDRLLTAQMGGLLPEQPDLSRFHHVLDVGCGPGDWLLQLARLSPRMTGVGIELNEQMVQSARSRAAHQGFSERLSFRVMDALAPLPLPDQLFDLVNLRLGLSFVRTWEWPLVLLELCRVTCTDGIVRLTEPEVLHISSSPALTRLGELFVCAFARAGHLFAPTSTGLTEHLAPLLHRVGCQQVQHQMVPLHLAAGTDAGRAYVHNVQALLQVVRPFLEHRGCLRREDEDLDQQVLREIQQLTFHATWTFHTVWGKKREQE